MLKAIKELNYRPSASARQRLASGTRRNLGFVVKEADNPYYTDVLRGIETNLIDVDNELASCEAVQHLLALGHAEIVHFSGPPYSEHSEERIQGVRRAFSESHLKFDVRCVVQAGDALEEGYRAAFDYFSARDTHPTAVTCYNDLVALGVLKALKELDIRVPEDISLVGFDNLNILEYLSIALTTINVPRYEMGARAAEILIQKIESPDGQSFEKVTLEASLVVRGSTAAPRARIHAERP